MTYDPNDNRPDLRDQRPDLVTNNVGSRSSGASWVPWVAVLAVLLVGIFIWGSMGGGEPGTDPATTSSTTGEMNDAPASDPLAPAAPAPGGAADDVAPATPPAGGDGG